MRPTKPDLKDCQLLLCPACTGAWPSCKLARYLTLQRDVSAALDSSQELMCRAVRCPCRRSQHLVCPEGGVHDRPRREGGVHQHRPQAGCLDVHTPSQGTTSLACMPACMAAELMATMHSIWAACCRQMREARWAMRCRHNSTRPIVLYWHAPVALTAWHHSSTSWMLMHGPAGNDHPRGA